MEAAFFDLDKTIIARSSGLAFGKSLYKEGLVSRRLLVRAAIAQFVYLLVGADEAKMEKMRARAQTHTVGWSREHIKSIINDVMGDVITPIIYREALDLIEEHHSAGLKVVIVSSSPEEIVTPLSSLLGADAVIASKAAVDEKGLYTGEIEFYCYGENKVKAISEMAVEEGIDLLQSYAYSDSITDVPMLRAVGHAYAVNPDRALAKVARDEAWEILRFTSPVTIRQRIVQMVPARSTLLSSKGVALLLAAGAVYFLLRRRRS